MDHGTDIRRYALTAGITAAFRTRVQKRTLEALAAGIAAPQAVARLEPLLSSRFVVRRPVVEAGILGTFGLEHATRVSAG